ncbi:MAG: GNAT family N-acetyltransferase [Clostridia bacterium]|nr:GNAT family N-acetyltransferase [Clostridia bacterium]MCI9275978.1 GNAT family N-acetyltransferase [Clostridia bacterium]
MIEKVENKDLEKLRNLFKDIRFYMGNSVLDGTMGEAYTDNISNPNFAILIVRKYCFMSGNIGKEDLHKLIDNKLKQYIIIPSNSLKNVIEEIFKDNINKLERYSIKKNPIFDKQKLQKYIEKVPEEYHIQSIDNNIAKKIKEEKFINITDNYEKNGIGYCCIYNDEIIGVASSNIFYKDGIEVNIKVKDEYRRRGIATALASKLILKCLEENKSISWDAANLWSVSLAEKLGFEYDSTYNIYALI